MTLEPASPWEALARACQLVAGQATAWYEPPTSGVLLEFFADLPATTTYGEAIVNHGVLTQFFTRFSVTIHSQFHQVHGQEACEFVSPPLPLLSTHVLEARSVTASWWDRYRRDFDRCHAAPEIRARRLIQTLFRQRITSHDLARRSGIDRRALERRFKARFGETMCHYRSRLRVAEAIRLMREGQMETVAGEVGWKSRKDVYRALQQHTGLTPREVRSMEEERLSRTLEGLAGRYLPCRRGGGNRMPLPFSAAIVGAHG